MATFLDVGLVSFLTPIFIFLFLFAIFYALLKKFKIFGDKTENLSAVASLSLALIVLFSTPARTIVHTMTPMIAVVFVLVFLAFLFFMFLGVKGEDMVTNVAKSPGFYTTMIIAFIVIFLIALSQAFGPIFATNLEAGFWNATKRLIFSPRVLGALFLLAIAAYAVRYLGSTR